METILNIIINRVEIIRNRPLNDAEKAHAERELNDTAKMIEGHIAAVAMKYYNSRRDHDTRD